MDDCIIEGIDTVISNEEIVNNWDAKASRKIINKLSVCENEKVLDDVLRDYVWVLQHQARNFKMRKLLKEKIITHVKVFHLCCIATSNLPTELQSYWENMENVLVILCNLELDLARHLKLDNIKVYKEKIVELTTNLIYLLSVFLLGNNTRICHVLLKLHVRHDSRAWKDVMKVVYRHFLVMVPIKDKSEENFCRNYLLFQNYKKLVHKENHVKMDSVLFERFNMSHDFVCNSRTLRKILCPTFSSLVDLVDMLTDSRQIAVDNYFKHIDRKNKDDDYIPFSINLESDSEDEDQSALILGKRSNDSGIGEIKIENIEDTTNYYESGHIICVDDDSDVEEISLPIVSKTISKAPSLERTETYVSFLDSINISGELLEESTSLIADRSLPITDMLSSPETSALSPPLPFLELYIDNLKSKGQVLDTFGSKEFNSNKFNNSSESSTINNNQSENIMTEVSSESSNSLSYPAQKPSTEVIEEPNIEDCEISPINAENESSRNLEKSLDSPTNNDHFSFISGLITPPISDRANDEISADLNHVNNGSENVYVPNTITINHIPYHQYESEMEMSVNNCVTTSHSTLSNVLENESCVVTEENINDNTECEIINTNLSTDSQENVTTPKEQLELNKSLTIQGDSELAHISKFKPEEPVITSQVEKLHINADIEPISLDNCVTLSHSLLSNELESESCVVTQRNIDDNTECEVISTNLSAESQKNVITPPEQPEPNESLDIQGESELEHSSTPEAEEPVITAQVEKQHINAVTKPNSPERVSETENVSASLEIIQPMDTILDESQPAPSEIELTVISPSCIDIENEESQCERLTENEDHIVISENLTPEDMILDESLLTAEITETILTPVVPTLKSPSFTENFPVNVAEGNVEKDKISLDVGYGGVNEMIKTIEGSRNDSYQNACKIQASVSMSEMINGVNIRISPKLNDGHINNVSKSKPSTEAYSSEKVLYTTTERVSAPLSVFSKFERTQSKLAEKGFSGSITGIYSYPDTHSDHSNSNDSLHSFGYIRSQSQVKQVGLSKPDSPTSPLYEQIQAQDYENHILSVDYDHLINTINSSPLSHISKTAEPKSNLEITRKEVINSRKRKLDLGTNQHKRTKVNFGPTEFRIIPAREDLKLIEDEILEEASESMKEYKIGTDDVKLVYLQPQIPIKVESVSELQEKEQKLKIWSLLHNNNSNANGKSCILKRVDYKKIENQMDHCLNLPQRNFGHKISNLIGKKSAESTPIDPVPSGYIPPTNRYSPGLPYNYESTVSNSSTGRQYQSDARLKVVGKAKQLGVRSVPKRQIGPPKRLDSNYTFSTKGTT